ncbi:hypothetical protein [Azospirillum sp. TSO22-1]|uniref:hypothetical protein n=1 Tax=Azospirillum sp. TSO22-1 TaxID=716789 RepID=UPI000D6093F8|nr:hypothetical protein [Azospirillum sp. TSO22-1]PWC55568.1 hypothetical protein TSO221_04645 [Azospirillum sp. TSO22-1]
MSNTTLLLIAIGAIMLAALPVAALMKDFLPGFLERSAGLDQLENRIYVLHSEAQDLQDRVNGAVSRRNQQSSEKHRLESDIRRMEKAIADLAEQPPLFVHEVGEPSAGTSKYTVNVSREAAAAAARANGERAQANPIWRYTNIAEVWAGSFEDAKQQVETAFPFKLGYQKSFQKAGGTAAEKMVAEAQARALAEAKAAMQ